MLKQLLIMLSVVFLFQACESDHQTDKHSQSSSTTEPMLEKAWELSGFMAPESVVYSPEQQLLYVSNINGNANEKNGNGFISKISTNGEIIEMKWVEGMNAPKGLAIHGDSLYVADIDELIKINIQEGTISQRYPAENAQFLNDVTATKNGAVFVSDMATNTIYCLHDGKFEAWLQSDELNSPNGLHAEKDHIIVGTWGKMTDGFQTDVPGHLISVSYSDKAINSLGDGSAIGNLDGVEAYGNRFLVTDWMAGTLFLIDPDKNSVNTLLQLEQGMADHEWLEQTSLILLPMMNSGQLLAYHYH